jgi:hypothetical protein
MLTAAPRHPPGIIHRPSSLTTITSPQATALSDIAFAVDCALRTGRLDGGASAPSATLAAASSSATSASQLLELEGALPPLLQRLGGELAALDKFAEAYSASEPGRLQPFRAAHQRGVVAVLYTRLRELLGAVGAVGAAAGMARQASAADADDEDAAAVPAELLPPPLELLLLELGLSDAGGGGAGDDAGRGAVESSLPSGLRQRHAAGAAMSGGGGGGGGGKPALASAPAVGGALAQELVEAPRERESTQRVDAASVERQMSEVSSMLSLISERLLEQTDDVQAVLEDAMQARGHVQAGTSELRAANARGGGSSLRNAVVLLLLILAASLVFMDWYDRE